MRLFAGTSGYSYKEWKGTFYPADLPDKEMLKYYAERLPSVEINNTFYRMPNPAMLESWNEQVGPDFRFVLKASRKITHSKPLKDKADETAYLMKTAATLGERLGGILFQLPPYLRMNLDLLSTFLGTLPAGHAYAFEFRHRSWFQNEVYEMLRKNGAALCCSDTSDEELSKFVATTDWGYLRLRRPDYSEADLQEWASRILEQEWDSAYIFFKHEEEGAGPRLAKRFLQLTASQRK